MPVPILTPAAICFRPYKTNGGTLFLPVARCSLSLLKMMMILFLFFGGRAGQGYPYSLNPGWKLTRCVSDRAIEGMVASAVLEITVRN